MILNSHRIHLDILEAFPLISPAWDQTSTASSPRLKALELATPRGLVVTRFFPLLDLPVQRVHPQGPFAAPAPGLREMRSSTKTSHDLLALEGADAMDDRYTRHRGFVGIAGIGL